jgi:hypothetical protein
MKTRLTPEELARAHDGLCGVSIGDGDCSCLVRWVEGLQKDLDAAEKLSGERLRLVYNVKSAYCHLACKHPDPRDMQGKTQHTPFCVEVSDYILRDPKAQPYDPDRCFCAGTWHCKWCGKESCNGKDCRK